MKKKIGTISKISEMNVQDIREEIYDGVASTLKKLHDPATTDDYSIKNLVCSIRKYKSVNLISEKVLDIFKVYRLKTGFMNAIEKAIDDYDQDEEVLSALVLLLLYEWHEENNARTFFPDSQKNLDMYKSWIKKSVRSIFSYDRKRHSIYYDAMIEAGVKACETFPDNEFMSYLLDYIQGKYMWEHSGGDFCDFPEWLRKYMFNVYGAFHSQEQEYFEYTTDGKTYFHSFEQLRLKILEEMNVFGVSDIFNINPDFQQIISEKVKEFRKPEYTRIKELFCNDETIDFCYSRCKKKAELQVHPVIHPEKHEYERFHIVKEILNNGYYLPSFCTDFRSFVYNDVFQPFGFHLHGYININIGFLKKEDICLDFHPGSDPYSLYLEQPIDNELFKNQEMNSYIHSLPYGDKKPYLCLQISYYEDYELCNYKNAFSELKKLIGNRKAYINDKFMIIICPLENGPELFNTCMDKSKLDAMFKK